MHALSEKLRGKDLRRLSVGIKKRATTPAIVRDVAPQHALYLFTLQQHDSILGRPLYPFILVLRPVQQAAHPLLHASVQTSVMLGRPHPDEFVPDAFAQGPFPDLQWLGLERRA